MNLAECSSLNCSNYDCSYCQDCSHSIYVGRGKDKNGKLWRWEFNSRFGPLFIDLEGEPLEDQPTDENHPAWKPFERWLKRNKINI